MSYQIRQIIKVLFMKRFVGGLKEANFDYQTTDQTVTVLGVPKHAKDASQGVNAVIRLASVLAPLQPHPALHF